MYSVKLRSAVAFTRGSCAPVHCFARSRSSPFLSYPLLGIFSAFLGLLSNIKLPPSPFRSVEIKNLVATII